MFKLFGVILVIIGGALGTDEAQFTATPQASDCTGTFVCTLNLDSGTPPDMSAVLQDTNGKVQFLKGADVIFEVTGDGTTNSVADGAGGSALTGITATTSGVVLTLTFSTSFRLNKGYEGTTDWTCKTEATDSANIFAAEATGVTVTISDVSSCGTTVTVDSCAQTVTCDLGDVVADVQSASGVIQFLTGTSTIVYQIKTDDTVVGSDGTTAVTGATAAAPVTGTGNENKATVTIGSTGTWDSATIDASWTCKVISASKIRYLVLSSALQANSICTTISMNACSKTMTCDLGVSVATVQSQGGTIFFKKAGTTMFQIAASNDDVTSNGAAAVTGVTAAAPASTATADANKATLTFDATATFDSTLDGSWTCDVTGASTPNNVISASTTLSTTCGAEMNKVAGLLVALMVAIKVLLF